MPKKKFFTMPFLLLCITLGCSKTESNPSPKNSTKKPGQERQSLPQWYIRELKVDPKIDEEMAKKGKQIFGAKCTSCHKIEVKYIGPALKGVTKRRKPAWIMNMILHPEWMIQNDPIAKKLIASIGAPMANQHLKKEEARAVLEFLRKKDEKP